MLANPTTTLTKRSYLHEVDFMRLFFIAGVLLNHTINAFIGAMDAQDQFSPEFLKSVRLIFHFSRNSFLLVSGLVLTLNYFNRHYWLTFYRKRFAGSFWPYIIWAFILLSLIVIVGGTHFKAQNFTTDYFTLLIHGSSFHLYFMLLIMQLYLVFPAIVWLFKNWSHQYILLISFISQLLLDTIIKYQLHNIDRSNWPYWFKAFSINIFSYQFYFIFGTYLCLHYQTIYQLLQKHLRLLIILATGLAFGTIIYINWFNMTLLKLNYDAATSTHQPYLQLYATAMILLGFWLGKQYATHRTQLSPQFDWLIKNGAKISFGIYLDQTFGLIILKQLLKLYTVPNWLNLIFLPIGYLLVFSISFGFAYFCYKVAPFGFLIGRPQWHLTSLFKHAKVSHD